MVVITVANFCLYEILYTLEGEFLMLGCTEHISTHVKSINNVLVKYNSI